MGAIIAKAEYNKPVDVDTKLYKEYVEQLPSLEGKTIAITGCTTGCGLVAAITSAKLGAANILMVNRPSDRGDKAEQTVKESIKTGSNCKVETIDCDLRYFESVQEAIDTIKNKYDSIDVLVNNAGIMAYPDRAGPDGFDIQMQVNYLSHFKLTKGLFPLVKEAAKKRGEARIVNHSSPSRESVTEGLLDKKYFERNGNGKLGGDVIGIFDQGPRFYRYSVSKLATSVFSAALADKVAVSAVEGDEIKVVTASAGLAATNLQVTASQHGASSKIMNYVLAAKAQSAEDGALPLLSAMYDPSTENKDFWEPELNGLKGKPVKKEMDEASTKDVNIAVLWKGSEEAIESTFDV